MATIKSTATGRLEKAAEYYARNPRETTNFGNRTKSKLVQAETKRIKNKQDYEDNIPEAMTPRKRK